MMKEIARNTVCGPVTRNYPAVKRPPFPGERGKLVMEEGKCIFCGIWRKEMPVSCPDRDPQARSSRGRFDRFRCILCGSCVEACPKKCLHLVSRLEPKTSRADSGRVSD